MIRIILFVCSALLFLAGGWIRIQTWGSRLLYVHSVLGRFYRIYLVLWLLALIFFIAGMYMSRKKAMKEREEGLGEISVKEVPKISEEISAEKVPEIPEEISAEKVTEIPDITPAEEENEITCPNCGTKLKPGAVFCKNCGCRIKEENV